MMSDEPSGISFGELAQVLAALEPAAVLAPPRILRRVIKQHRGVASLGLQVPHRKSYVIERDALLALATPGELELPPGRELPPTVLLLSQPRFATFAGSPRPAVLARYWRLLFHARVHQELDRRAAEGKLSAADVRKRVGQLGAEAFEEIRSVLRQERYLLDPDDDEEAYREFAAVYLELRAFDRNQLPYYFPSLADPGDVEALLTADVDADALFIQTRPPGAEAPAAPAAGEGEEGPAGAAAVSQETPGRERYQPLMRKADRREGLGDVVRAAILRTQAARLAPPGLVAEAKAGAGAALDRLTARLRPALLLTDDEARSLRKVLSALVEPAGEGFWPVEARLLSDLQKVCVDHERETYTLDLVEWALTLGKRPVKRPLPGQQDVLAVKHLAGALKRVTTARLSDPDRRRLALLLKDARHRCEGRLRERFRPIVEGVLEEAGLRPHNFPERVSRLKLVEELLDRVVERGFLSMGDLRDALSRNQLKLPDLAGAEEFLRGDALLNANRRLAVALDGIYHRGEVYLRWLQRLSALSFGTPAGRFLTRYLALPFGGAYVILFGAQEMIGEVVKLTVGHSPAEPGEPPASALEDPLSALPAISEPPVGVGPGPAVHHAAHGHAGPHLLNWPSLLLLGLVLFALINSPAFRRQTVNALTLCGRALRGLFYDLPAAALSQPLVQALWASPPVQWAWRWVLKPLPLAATLAALFSLLTHRAVDWATGTGLCYLPAAFLLNSRAGRDAEEVFTDWAERSWKQFSSDILPGLYRLIVGTFKELLVTVERLLYSVDEWLRFRAGDSRLSLLVKPVLGLTWFFVTYLVRVFINLFVEPTFNPIKHFPVVTVAAKILLPVIPVLAPLITSLLRPFVGLAVAGLAAGLILFFLPGLAGFLVWELKENWRLYRANRAATLRPVLVGHHGETVLRLLRPGIHSGTVPKLFAKIRKALRRARRSGSWRAFRKHREALHHVEEAVSHFAERDLLAPLNRSRSWGSPRVGRGHTHLGTNLIRVGLTCPELGPEELTLSFSIRSGALVAGVQPPGWVGRLSPGQWLALTYALAGFFHLAGVAAVRSGGGASANGGATAPIVPFAATPMAWERWVGIWELDQEGKELPEPRPAERHLLPDGKACPEPAGQLADA